MSQSLFTMPTAWPHQDRGVQGVVDAFEMGEDRVCLTSPTGGGKSLMAARLMEWGLDRGYQSVFYTNRRLLIEQMCKAMTAYGFTYGVRAAGHDDQFNSGEPIQIASTQTDHVRAHRYKKWKPHNAQLVIWDELHLQKGKMAAEIMDYHDTYHNSRRVGLTATPLGVHELFPYLVQAGSVSECRAVGALLPCHTYGPTEFDTRNIERCGSDGEFSIKEVRRKWSTKIFGHVLHHWQVLNPEQRPTILFAPGVEESVWFAEQFEGAGVAAAHIDGADLYMDRTRRKSTPADRAELVDRLRTGNIKVLCNRFVCREGVDIPELFHGILATPIGSLVSYLQTVGRILRNHTSLDHVVLQDHGGNWWRHGSPNIDRDWSECFELSPRVITDLRLESMRDRVADPETGDPAVPEPIVCPMCGKVRNFGVECRKDQGGCGYTSRLKTRKVLQSDGTLTNLTGDLFKPRNRHLKNNTEQIWKGCYHRCRNASRTFKQAEALFFIENHYWPPHNLPLMPINKIDWFRRVDDVPKGILQ